MKRKTFLQNTAMAAAGIVLGNTASLAEQKNPNGNKLPYWKGFNLLDFFSPDPANNHYSSTEEHLKWMSS